MRSLTLTLPIYWTNQKKRVKSTTHLVGLNFYRNAPCFVQNKMKQEFHELVINQVSALDTPIEEFTLHTDLYYKNPLCDGRNVVPMVEKFVLDALQGPVLTNDNVKCDLGGSWSVIEMDKENPRVEITLTEKDTNEKTTDRD